MFNEHIHIFKPVKVADNHWIYTTKCACGYESKEKPFELIKLGISK